MKSYRRKDCSSISKRWRRIVKAEIDAKNSQLPMMNEMAIPLSKYTEKIESFRFELVKNWCLCKWCQMFDPSNENFNHWKEELCTYINRLKLVTLKNKANKRTHLDRILIDDYDYKDKDMIYDIINDKFNREHIIDQTQKNKVSQAFVNEIDELLNVIAIRSASLDEYVQKTFDS